MATDDRKQTFPVKTGTQINVLMGGAVFVAEAPSDVRQTLHRGLVGVDDTVTTFTDADNGKPIWINPCHVLTATEWERSMF